MVNPVPEAFNVLPKLQKRIFFSFLVSLLFFCGVEMLLRIFGFEYKREDYYLESKSAVEPHWVTRGLVRDPTLPWSWIPGSGMTATQPMDHGFTYNRHGFIGPAVALKKPDDVVRVICMGDSCTLGWNSPEGETYPDHLRRLLESTSPGMFQVINAGVSGYSSFQGLHDYHQRVHQWRPDILVVSYNWNDHGDAPDRAGLALADLTGDRSQFPDKDQPAGTRIVAGEIPLQRFRTLQMLYRIHDAIVCVFRPEQPPLAEDLADNNRKPGTFQPGTGLRRVSPESYRENLKEFIRLSESHQFTLIFLTQAANPVQHRDAEPWITLLPTAG